MYFRKITLEVVGMGSTQRTEIQDIISIILIIGYEDLIHGSISENANYKPNKFEMGRVWEVKSQG